MTYILAGKSLVLDTTLCTGCGLCLEVCPHAVFTLVDGAATGRVAEVSRRSACMECGACRENCPAKAIQVDSGVGCVAAIITGMLRGTEPSCDCDGSSSKPGCC